MTRTNDADLRQRTDPFSGGQSAYLPRWRALLLARVRFGEEAKLWRDGPRYCVGVVARRIAPGRTEVRLFGEGASWRDAVSAISAPRCGHESVRLLRAKSSLDTQGSEKKGERCLKMSCGMLGGRENYEKLVVGKNPNGKSGLKKSASNESR